MNIVYLNGEYLPIEEARVPVLDRGFIFGDAVYEVIPVYGRHPFRIDDHLRRLRRSLAAIRLELSHDDDNLKALIVPIVEQAEWSDQGIYIQVTRGPAPRDLAIPKSVTPTLFIMAMRLPTPSPDDIEHGVSAITYIDNRWSHCDIKATSLIANVLLRQYSVDQACAETILIRDGYLTEGTSSSIFVVIDDKVSTPPSSNLILPGVTHELVIELANNIGMPILQSQITQSQLTNAQEIWIASSTKEIMAVTNLDGRSVGTGDPGKAYRRIRGAFVRYKEQHMCAAGR